MEIEDVMADELKLADSFALKSKARHTARNYRTVYRQYEAWCKERGFKMFPGSVRQIRMWLAFLGDGRYKPTTIRAKFAAIRRLYDDNVGVNNVTKDDEVDRVYKGIQRELGGRPKRASPLTRELLVRIVQKIPDHGKLKIKGKRDRALLLLGYAGAFRRAELVAFDWSDVQWQKNGIVLDLRKNKTDQRAKGQWVPIFKGKNKATCPVRALMSWRRCCKGVPMFHSVGKGGVVLGTRLSENGVALVVKSVVKSIGLDSAMFSGHSMRSGMITDLISAGVPGQKVMRRSRHKDVGMLRVYDRPEQALKGVNFSDLVGL